jgi:hypothetical protein
MSAILAAIIHFVERTAAIARTGLAFSPQGFDAERYEELLREAAAMRAALDGAGPAETSELLQRWRAEVREGYDGYVTAATGCGIIAFNPRGEVLMIRRPNGRWWYPTGFCEVGKSLAENVVKEAEEETGLIVRPLGDNRQPQGRLDSSAYLFAPVLLPDRGRRAQAQPARSAGGRLLCVGATA